MGRLEKAVVRAIIVSFLINMCPESVTMFTLRLNCKTKENLLVSRVPHRKQKHKEQKGRCKLCEQKKDWGIASLCLASCVP